MGGGRDIGGVEGLQGVELFQYLDSWAVKASISASEREMRARAAMCSTWVRSMGMVVRVPYWCALWV